MIARSVIDNVRLRADIVSVVGGYCDLKKSGSRLVCCCPFHKEKTPSFVVNANTNRWHCFGACGEGGDPISFVMKKEGVDFTTAVRTLAAKYRVPVEEEKDERTAEQREQDTKSDALLTLYAYVQKYYVENLYADTPQAKAALDYACKRWDRDFVKEYGLGYATDDWQGLINYANSHSLSVGLMKEVGLVCTSEKGREYDFFRDRLMIPIRDKYGKVIGYTARYISTHKAENARNRNTAQQTTTAALDTPEAERQPPKYINSKTSLLYKKESSVFGIDIAWRASQKSGQFVLVEGAPDVMRLHQIGVMQAVACLGSQWMDTHFATLKRYTETLVFVPDADEIKEDNPFGTGIRKVLEAGKRAWQQGFDVRVREIPLGFNNTKQDADSYCKSRNDYDELPSQPFHQPQGG